MHLALHHGAVLTRRILIIWYVKLTPRLQGLGSPDVVLIDLDEDLIDLFQVFVLLLEHTYLDQVLNEYLEVHLVVLGSVR